jgi:hypothetical protein
MQKGTFTDIEIGELLELIGKVVRKELKNAQETNESSPEDKYITPTEVCTEFKISKTTFYKWLKRGIFCIHKIGNRTYVKRNEFLSSMHKVDLSSGSSK